jgi:hypothetical protein
MYPYADEIIEGLVRDITRRRVTMDFVPEKLIIKSAAREISKKVFRAVRGKSGRLWLFPSDGDPSLIHIEADLQENKPGYRGSRGYGGAIVSFTMEDGTIIKLQGPWNSNADALYEDTGVDLRYNHETFVVIGKRICYDRNKLFGTITDVVYIDDKPKRGSFDRYKEIGQKIANKLGIPVFYYMKSYGGALSGRILPEI